MSVSDLIDIRERIKADHADLRSLLRGLCLAAACVVGDARSDLEEAAVEALRLAASTFVERFHRHLEVEERDLLPILRRLDGWAHARAERADYEHQVQRLVLGAMLEDARLVRRDLDLDELLGFVRALLRDMDLEEAWLAALVEESRAGLAEVSRQSRSMSASIAKSLRDTPKLAESGENYAFERLDPSPATTGTLAAPMAESPESPAGATAPPDRTRPRRVPF